jgi:hypothetical protein
MGSYRDYIETLHKKQLVNLICGDDEDPPILTRNEPTYSRPQIIWALMRVQKMDLEEAEAVTESLINKLEGFQWDKLYNYDWARFDVKKPGFRMVLIIMVLASIGAVFGVITLVEWIYKWI